MPVPRFCWTLNVIYEFNGEKWQATVVMYFSLMQFCMINSTQERSLMAAQDLLLRTLTVI